MILSIMNKNKILNLLGLANKAGKIISGDEKVTKSLKDIFLVFVASDVSLRTKDKYEKKCFYYNVRCDFSFTSNELEKALGKSRKIIGISDKGFALAFEKLRGEMDES